ncbi:MAG TPA: hypothetical protein VFU53_11525, partial [Burkholderiales bacterium]|nr:hypothetical protein [Burkholderiales bacterium]
MRNHGVIHRFGLALVSVLLLAPAPGFAADVIINNVPLDASTVKALEDLYGVPIKPGRYWYDIVSGVWGNEGGPAAGQVHAGLRIGGPMQRDASSGDTGVIVNGRELHTLDVRALERCVPV